ncbi:MAG: response regulator [Pseudomonadota bacterium]
MTQAPKRILLVEDEKNIAMALSYIIEREGYVLDHVADGAEAIAAVDATRPDLVVLDAMLPEVSGYSVCQHIRESDELSDTKVLMISAAGETARRRALAMGADAFFLKPFDTRELTGEMQALLDGASRV